MEGYTPDIPGLLRQAADVSDGIDEALFQLTGVELGDTVQRCIREIATRIEAAMEQSSEVHEHLTYAYEAIPRELLP